MSGTTRKVEWSEFANVSRWLSSALRESIAAIRFQKLSEIDSAMLNVRNLVEDSDALLIVSEYERVLVKDYEFAPRSYRRLIWPDVADSWDGEKDSENWYVSAHQAVASAIVCIHEHLFEREMGIPEFRKRASGMEYNTDHIRDTIFDLDQERNDLEFITVNGRPIVYIDTRFRVKGGSPEPPLDLVTLKEIHDELKFHRDLRTLRNAVCEWNVRTYGKSGNANLYSYIELRPLLRDKWGSEMEFPEDFPKSARSSRK